MNPIRLFTILFLFLAATLAAQDVAIYVSDAGNFSSPPWQILKYDANGENPEAYISENIVWPQDIVFLEEQEVVLISNLGSPGYISKHHVSTGEFIENFASGISGPTRMKIGADDLLYVLQWSNTNNKVLRYQLDGTFVDEFTSAGVPQSIGLDWDTDGNLYVSSYGGKYIQKFDPEGNDLGAFIDEGLSGPTNIWFEENGDLLVVDYNAGNIKRYSADGEFLGIYISGLNAPEGVAFYADGQMLLGNGGTHAVKLFDDSGTFVEDFIPNGLGNLLTPNAVVIREVTTVGVGEVPAMPGQFLMPSSGRTFRVADAYASKLATVTIYGVSGKLSVRTDLASQRNWYATHIPGGVYVAVATTLEGEVLKQKVVVQ